MTWSCCVSCSGSEIDDKAAEPLITQVNHSFLSEFAEAKWKDKGLDKVSRKEKRNQTFKPKTKEDADVESKDKDDAQSQSPDRFHSSPGRIVTRGEIAVSDPEAERDTGFSEMKLKRKDRKSQTVPVSLATRRSTITLSKDVLAKLMREQGSISKNRLVDAFDLVDANLEVVKEQELKRAMRASTTCFMYGTLKGANTPAEERERKFTVGTDLPDAFPISISCQKGDKGDSSPNQDNFSLTCFANGYSLVCVFDGHGQWGHLVSTRAVQTVPYFLLQSKHFPSNIGEALVEAFQRAHQDVVALALRQNWNIMVSGATAVAALWKDNKVWTANCGDSRCVVASLSEKSVIFETVDHKLENPTERARIASAGGRIATTKYSDGVTLSRCYIGDEDYPGLAMSRSLGDYCVKNYGVIATPDVVCTEVDLSRRPFLILSSDGIWEFLESEEVISQVKETVDKEGADKALPVLHAKAMDTWLQEEGDYIDDITSVLVQLAP